jgi:alkanesulfonate monooxygenase SsuD/methylene tetrahydromethanopterin reductase-like flavin-dependent oxidoreductase (luciferase family)
VAEELVAFGVGPAAAGPRVERLAESLDVITRLWSDGASSASPSGTPTSHLPRRSDASAPK